ncbi:ABC transporter permease [Halobacillus trueperi]|uniref:Peptide/nickel transport system permease protein n=2 Tax=Halobacillus TaxID=45667 RepID=A0A1H0VN94_HALAD|nr:MULTISPECIES: ABC transporter permease subunit [Halobacillus]RDY72353.1 ABC transporter permease [Halobacillus trueperi]SDP79751.1 peptide/nickel transport system permease protein [Halobacillus aidingensis]
MRFIKFFAYYVFGIVGILLVSTTPALFRQGAFLDLGNYIKELNQLLASVVNPGEWTYLFKGRPVPILEYLWDPYQYSMTVFFGGILLGFVLAFAGAFFTVFLPKWLRSVVDRILGLLESVPDLLLAFSLQLFIVWFYKQTEILLISFASLGQEKVYLLPMFAIAVLPMVTMYKIILALIEEEWTKSYIQMARGKGLEKAAILCVHTLRNIGKSTFYHSKIIVWGALSSLLIIEYIFNMNGITTAFLDDFRPIVSSFILLMLFTPFYIIYQGTELFLFKDEKKSEEVATRMNSFVGAVSFKGGRGWLSHALSEIGAHFKNIKFLLGFTVITGAIIISIAYTMTAEPLIDQHRLIYDDEGTLVSSMPHTPEYVFLGTDALGFSVFDQIIVGAKYTIIFGLVIAFLRMGIGFLLAIPYAFFLPKRVQLVFEKFVDSMHFLPMTIIAFLLLKPVLWMPPGGFTTTEIERILYQGIILTLLAVPLVITLFGNEMKLIMKEEFVTSTKVLGGSSVHLLWKHLMPHLSARMGIIFGQQFIQTLLIFIHLGVFDIYFGGTKVSYDFVADPPTSTTYEWSGMIGAAKDSLMTGRWWLIIPTLLCFMAIIVSMQLIIQGIKEVQQRRVGVPVEQNTWLKRVFRRKETHREKDDSLKEADFVFVQSSKQTGGSDSRDDHRDRRKFI